MQQKSGYPSGIAAFFVSLKVGVDSVLFLIDGRGLAVFLFKRLGEISHRFDAALLGNFNNFHIGIEQQVGGVLHFLLQVDTVGGIQPRLLKKPCDMLLRVKGLFANFLNGKLEIADIFQHGQHGFDDGVFLFIRQGA